ncbi:Arogenate dehydratase/prephenate dehydratase 2, chloroplastic [Capsicum annuum]|nr:Arogenate dehydratase/prephenate dehydratase 2, chloroplastic [Capsicum annuum]
MSSTILRSPKLPCPPDPTTSIPPPHNQSFFTPLPKRRRCISIYTCCTAGDQSSNSAFGSEIKKGQAIELNKVNDDNPYEFNAKDSPNPLPRPLTSADLSNMASEGSRLRVAYQGVRGAYSESAAEKAYPNCEAVPCEQFDTAFEVSFPSDSKKNMPQIVGLDEIAVKQPLAEMQGKVVYNKPQWSGPSGPLTQNMVKHQALAQCENTLTKLGLVREAVDDTAGAAKYIAFNKLNDAGAVASLAASRIYGLNVLAQDIQDDSDNVTRFLMLAREPIIPRTDKPFKTSVVFSLDEGPGVLFKALAVFAMRNINLTKIESRPLQKQALRVLDDSVDGFPKYFPYLFYVDFEASMADQRAQNALGHLKTKAAPVLINNDPSGGISLQFAFEEFQLLLSEIGASHLLYLNGLCSQDEAACVLKDKGFEASPLLKEFLDGDMLDPQSMVVRDFASSRPLPLTKERKEMLSDILSRIVEDVYSVLVYCLNDKYLLQLQTKVAHDSGSYSDSGVLTGGVSMRQFAIKEFQKLLSNILCSQFEASWVLTYKGFKGLPLLQKFLDDDMLDLRSIVAPVLPINLQQPVTKKYEVFYEKLNRIVEDMYSDFVELLVSRYLLKLQVNVQTIGFLLESADSDIQLLGIKLLEQLFSEGFVSEVKGILRSFVVDVVPPLAHITWKMDSPEVQFKGAWALIHIISYYSMKPLSLIKYGLVEPLLELLEIDSVCEKAMEELQKIAFNPVSRDHALKCGALLVLLKKLSTSNDSSGGASEVMGVADIEKKKKVSQREINDAFYAANVLLVLVKLLKRLEEEIVCIIIACITGESTLWAENLFASWLQLKKMGIAAVAIANAIDGTADDEQKKSLVGCCIDVLCNYVGDQNKWAGIGLIEKILKLGEAKKANNGGYNDYAQQIKEDNNYDILLLGQSKSYALDEVNDADGYLATATNFKP